MTKTERWLNLLAFLLDRHYPVPREEILSQVDDYKTESVGGTEKARESVRGELRGGPLTALTTLTQLRLPCPPSPPTFPRCRRLPR